MLGTFGTMCFLFQIFFYRRIIAYFSLSFSFNISGFAMIATFAMQIIAALVIPRFTSNELFFAIANFVSLIPFTAGWMLNLTVVGTMVLNASNSNLQGMTQGTVTAISQLFRALGPLTVGALFASFRSISAVYLALVVVIIGYIAGFVFFKSFSDEEVKRVNPPKTKHSEQSSVEIELRERSDSDEEEAFIK
jgi:hypothetical protein